MVLDKLRDGLQGAINSLKKAVVVDKKTIKEYTKDIQKVLLASDVNVQLVLNLTKNIEERGLLEKPPGSLTRKENVIKITYDELADLLGTGAKIEVQDKQRILLVGVQGSGKTTTSAKLAKYFQKQGVHPRLICADTFRPAAYDQLKQLSEEIDAPFYGDKKEKDTLKIIEEGLRKFKNEGLVIIDSEGRHALNEDLMKDIRRTADTVKPDHVLLVLDGTIGQQAEEQAKAFKESADVNGVILTKLDGTAKGGGALSACAATDSTVYFIGTGEHIDDLEVFEPQRFVSRLIGFGDLQGLLEKAKEVEFDEESAKRLMTGKFNLNDVYQQIQQMNQMGPLNKVMEMIPGMGAKIPKELVDLQEDKLKSFRIIMDSMTKQEKEEPEIIKRERVSRIAAGSGRPESDVRELINYYKKMKKMMKSIGSEKKLARMMKRMGMGNVGM
ncbi:signal recognition particle protein Srp54 [Candidatus Altiarchaeota archaeon]